MGTKISALIALAAGSVDRAADVLPVVDTSATATKKVTVADLTDLVNQSAPALGGDLALGTHALISTPNSGDNVARTIIHAPTVNGFSSYDFVTYASPTTTLAQLNHWNALFNDTDGTLTFHPAAGGASTVTGTTNDLGDMRLTGNTNSVQTSKLAKNGQWLYYKVIHKNSSGVPYDNVIRWVTAYNASTFVMTVNTPFFQTPVTGDFIVLQAHVCDMIIGVNTGAGGAAIDQTLPNGFMNMEFLWNWAQPANGHGATTAAVSGIEWHPINFGLAGKNYRCMSAIMMADGPTSESDYWIDIAFASKRLQVNDIDANGVWSPYWVFTPSAIQIGSSASVGPDLNIYKSGPVMKQQNTAGSTFRYLPYVATRSGIDELVVPAATPMNIGGYDPDNNRVQIHYNNGVQIWSGSFSAGPCTTLNVNGLDLWFDSPSTTYGSRIRQANGNANLQFAMRNGSGTYVTLGQFNYQGDFIVGKGSALATNATAGFQHMPGGNGPPTGVPANAQTGSFAMYFDSANNNLYIYNGGWKKTTTFA